MSWELIWAFARASAASAGRHGRAGDVCDRQVTEPGKGARHAANRRAKPSDSFGPHGNSSGRLRGRQRRRRGVTRCQVAARSGRRRLAAPRGQVACRGRPRGASKRRHAGVRERHGGVREASRRSAGRHGRAGDVCDRQVTQPAEDARHTANKTAKSTALSEADRVMLVIGRQNSR